MLPLSAPERAIKPSWAFRTQLFFRIALPRDWLVKKAFFPFLSTNNGKIGANVSVLICWICVNFGERISPFSLIKNVLFFWVAIKRVCEIICSFWYWHYNILVIIPEDTVTIVPLGVEKEPEAPFLAVKEPSTCTLP